MVRYPALFLLVLALAPSTPAQQSISGKDPRTRIGSLPFVINKAGSYYLMRSLEMPASANGDGITIAAGDVTLDLNGFALTGNGQPGHGIYVESAVRNVRIYNGSIRSWGGSGVEALWSGAVSDGNVLLEDLRASENGGDGLRVATSSTVVRCVATDNSFSGIAAEKGSVIRDCATARNAVFGFWAGEACTLESCSTADNLKTGFVLSSNCTLRGCTSVENGEHGIFLSAGCTAVDCSSSGNVLMGFGSNGKVSLATCTSNGNDSDGFRASVESSLRDCTADSNGGHGIFATRSTIQGCTASNNTGVGIAGSGVISNCVARLNEGGGIDAQIRTQIRDCEVHTVAEFGIRVSSYCIVADNTTWANYPNDLAYGFLVTGEGNRISHNNASLASVGFQINGSKNFVVGNTTVSCVRSFGMAGGNTYGAIMLGGGGGISGADSLTNWYTN